MQFFLHTTRTARKNERKIKIQRFSALSRSSNVCCSFLECLNDEVQKIAWFSFQDQEVGRRDDLQHTWWCFCFTERGCHSMWLDVKHRKFWLPGTPENFKAPVHLKKIESLMLSRKILVYHLCDCNWKPRVMRISLEIAHCQQLKPNLAANSIFTDAIFLFDHDLYRYIRKSL